MKKHSLCIATILFIVLPVTFALANDYFNKDKLYFSTEEDFLAIDENGMPRLVSDGDLLNWNGTVVMTNRDLTRVFKEKNDLGLDALDVIDMAAKRVVFSTELDSTKGLFTHGDLLCTNGALIPQKALFAKFQFPFPPTNLGLDAVQFRGEKDEILKFLDEAASMGVSVYADDPERLPKDLEERGLDIWFSTDGTAPYPNYPMFFDGDLLSVVQGTVILTNSDLLPHVAPAGLPKKGADFGLDAFMCPRTAKEPMFFSTEILFNNEKFPFTDGDLLMVGVVGVIIPNIDFIDHFSPQVDFLGLDAVSYFEK